MRVDHLPDGSFKRILANRRNSFPKITRQEIAELTPDKKPEVVDLRTVRQFKYLCEFADKLSAFLGIPPLNLYWIPPKPYSHIRGYLTPHSASIVLMRDINLIAAKVVKSMAAHEAWHGMQGDLEEAIKRGGDLAQTYEHMREFQPDAFAALTSSWQATDDMLHIFEILRPCALDAQSDEEAFRMCTEPYEDHPALVQRRIALLGIEQSDNFRELVSRSRNRSQILDTIFKGTNDKDGIDALTDPADKEWVVRVVNSAPYLTPGSLTSFSNRR